MTANQPLLQVENLSTLFRKGDRTVSAVNGVSFSVAAGEMLALVGESGSGKSVTAHSILKLLPYPVASHPAGRVLLDGNDLLSLPEPELRAIRGKEIAMVFQEPMTALNPLKTVQDQIIENINSCRKLPKNEAVARTLQLLEQVRIDHPEEKLARYPHQLSGGQRQRVMIAMAIANNPRLLIADEPTTALDVTVQGEILALLKSLQQQSGMAILLITHDIRLVRRYADKVAVMQGGRIVESNTAAALFHEPQHDYTRSLLQEFRRGRNPVAPESPVLLEAANLSVTFRNGPQTLFRKPAMFTAVDNVSFSLGNGQTMGVIGESGSGKSTLANALLKLVPSTGSIKLCGEEVSALNQNAFRPFRKDLQVVFQDPFASLSPRMRIIDIVSEGLKVHSRMNSRLNSEEIAQRASAMLERVGLSQSILYRYPHEFSGGQRQRIAIARAVIMEPRCIILDEPTSALDRSIQFQVLDLLLDLQRDLSLTYLFISHDLRLVHDFCHRVLVMKEGKIIEQGTTEQIFLSPQNEYTRQLVEAACH